HDACMRVRAAQDRAEEEAGGKHVRCIPGGSGRALAAVHAGHRGPDDGEALIRGPDRKVLALDDDVALLDAALKLDLLPDDLRHTPPPGRGLVRRLISSSI